MSVIFVPHTNRSELAKRWRERLEVFEKIGSIKLKVVERTGSKLVDLLHKSNVWSDQDCQRQDCILCKSCTEEEKKGRCKSRNVIYETYCETCEDKIVKEKKLRNIEVSQRGKNDKIEEVEITDEKEKKRKDKENEKKSIVKKDIEKKEYSVKYVGETGRSAYERGKEHVEDFYNLSEKSHLLKHYILEHQKEIKMQDLKFGMRVREVFNTAIERQVGEAVAISVEQRKGRKLMNSKGEYNRCVVPRISTKSKKDVFDEKLEEDAEERIFQEKMKELRKEKRIRKLEKLKEKEENQPTLKKLKRICIEIGNDNIEKWNKRKKEELEKKKKLENEIEEDKKKKERRKLAEEKKRKL